MVLGNFKWEFSSSVIIAICALGLTIYQAFSINNNNNISHRPFIKTIMNHSPNNPSYVIKNSGNGIAIIKNQRFYVNGENVEFKVFTSELDRIMKDSMEDKNSGIIGRLDIGDCISPGEDWILYEYKTKNLSQEAVIELYEKIGIEIEYKSIYEEIYKYKSNSLSKVGFF
jgi:hypothetical protein